MLRRLLAIGAAAFLLTGVTPAGAAVSPVTDVSHACKGPNAQVEQASWYRYVPP